MSSNEANQPGGLCENSGEFRPTLVCLENQRDFLPHPASWVNSILVHVLILSAMLILNLVNGALRSNPELLTRPVVKVTPVLWPGGGGGDQSPTPASRGALPQFSGRQLSPPRVRLLIPDPQLPVQATMQGPPELKLPEMVPNVTLGDPLGVDEPNSGGPGKGDGIGDGDRGGIGPGRGPGYGPGPDGEPVYPMGSGVTAPVPLFKPEPSYSEEARKAKHEGTVTLLIVVGLNGTVTGAQVVRPLGMGLDEKALETVRTWQFRPGTRNGMPVAVRVLVEVSFRLF